MLYYEALFVGTILLLFFIRCIVMELDHFANLTGRTEAFQSY